MLQKFKYRFDLLISQNPRGLLILLTIGSLLILAFISGLITLFDSDSGSFWANYEEVINITLSPALKVHSSLFLTILYVFVAALGLLLISVLIGILTSIIESRIIELRRGRSKVLEKNHSVFLGWSNKLFTAIKELSEANKSLRDASVVVLSIRDKVFMEEYLLREIPENSTTKVICRTGDPSDSKDLEIISPNEARSIVLLATDDEFSDSMVLKRALALQKNELVNCPVIAEVNSAENAEALKLLSKLTVIQPRNFIMRLLAQSLKEPGLSKVYSELLTFEGKEIYFWPQENQLNLFNQFVVGRPFSEVVFEFENSSLIGVVHDYLSLDGNAQTTAVKLLPDLDYVIQSSDRLILISEDDSTIGGSVGKSTLNNWETKDNLDLTYTYVAKHITIIGWHNWGDILLTELQMQLPAGSQIELIYNSELSDGPDQSLIDSLTNLKINVQIQNSLKRDAFNGINWVTTDSILLLGYRDKLNLQQADAYTLLTFTHIKFLRDSQKRDINICCEILDPKNGELIEGTRDDEFVASDELVAKYLIQLSENKYLKAVYTDLLDESGSELFLRPALSYVPKDRSITFAELVNIGLTRNEIVVGLQLKTSARNHKIDSILSPSKKSSFQLREYDRIIVIANN